ncbi:MAG: hypothetical protein IT436_09025 [Phycisphaerales bacterium]|nr:hypothetical protein [Phycisphaerales bacterium]
MKTALACSTLIAFASLAPAGIGVETYGTAAPPRWAGGIWVHRAPFRDDMFADVTETLDGLGTITFSTPCSVRQVGSSWATWSHGYTGNVFYTNGYSSLTMLMDSGHGAFQFYAEPNPFGVFRMTATGSDGSSTLASSQFPDGDSGAAGWGYYTTGGGVHLVSVTVISDVDFAVGEFSAGWFPAPASLSLFALGGLYAGRRR